MLMQTLTKPTNINVFIVLFSKHLKISKSYKFILLFDCPNTNKLGHDCFAFFLVKRKKVFHCVLTHGPQSFCVFS